MNRVRLLLLSAYLIFVTVGAVVYVQAVSRMVLYTEADQLFPSSISIAEMEIPHYVGKQNYPVNCSFRFDNPSKVSIVIMSFSAVIAIDNGEAGSPYDGDRLQAETIGTAAESLGEAGPRLGPGASLVKTFSLNVPDYNSYRLDHLNQNGNYTVIVYDIALAYGYLDTSLLRQSWLGFMQMEVQPVD